MRFVFGFTLLTTLAAYPASASAEEWCGFQDKIHSLVKCGYSSLAECQQKEGANGAICIPDPSFASNRGRNPAARRPG